LAKKLFQPKTGYEEISRNANKRFIEQAKAHIENDSS
jgi:hypothetical protein